jgi:hypothetical protein
LVEKVLIACNKVPPLAAFDSAQELHEFC